MWSGTRLALSGTHQRAKWIRYQRLSPALVRPAPLSSRPVCPLPVCFLSVLSSVGAEGEPYVKISAGGLWVRLVQWGTGAEGPEQRRKVV